MNFAKFTGRGSSTAVKQALDDSRNYTLEEISASHLFRAGELLLNSPQMANKVMETALEMKVVKNAKTDPQLAKEFERASSLNDEKAKFDEYKRLLFQRFSADLK